MLNTIVVFDFETTGVDPNTCQPVQLAACAINSRTLEIKRGSWFCTDIKPTNFEIIERSNIEWHMKQKGCTEDELMQRWDTAPEQKHVIQNFVDYIHQHNWRKDKFTAPVPAGHNILKYDLPILDRIIKENKIKTPYLFNLRDYIDTMHLCMLWLESLGEPTNYNMDALREYFGFDETSKAAAHDAKQDVNDTVKILVRFMKMHRTIAQNKKFKDAFKDG